jgi:hypothetical protein
MTGFATELAEQLVVEIMVRDLDRSEMAGKRTQSLLKYSFESLLLDGTLAKLLICYP